jgi:hypothetical protein
VQVLTSDRVWKVGKKMRRSAVLCMVTFACITDETRVAAAIVAFSTPWVLRFPVTLSKGGSLRVHEQHWTGKNSNCLYLRAKAEHSSTGNNLQPWPSRRAMLEGSKSAVIASVCCVRVRVRVCACVHVWCVSVCVCVCLRVFLYGCVYHVGEIGV